MAQFDLTRAKSKVSQGPKTFNLGAPSSVDILRNTQQFPTESLKAVAKPTLGAKAKEFVLPSRGFSDKQITEAKTTIPEAVTGTAKAVGEIGAGIASLTREGLKRVPGPVGEYYKSPQVAETAQKVDEFLAPKTAGEAKAMRAVDIAGFAPAAIGRISKLSKIEELSKTAKNSLENSKDGIRDKSINFLRENPEEVSKGEVRVREIEDGSLVIEDGRHRLEVAKELKLPVNIVDVTSEYTGKPSAKVAQLVKDTADTVERGFVSSVKEKVPQATKVSGQYIPRSTDELSIKAANLIKDNPEAAERLALTGTDENAVATASELIKKLSNDAELTSDVNVRNALYDKVAEITNTLAPKLTEQGRAIQAASILGRMTPEGQLRFAAREIQKYNEANPRNRIPELSGEQAQELAAEMREINKLPDGVEKAMRFQKLQDRVRSLVPTPLWQKVTTVWKAGLLTGIKTTGLNLLSNASHALTEVAKDIPAVAFDSVASLFTGQRTKTFTLKKAFDGIKEGSVKGARYFATGFDERNIGQKLDYNRVNFGKGVVAKAFQGYTDIIFRAIGSSDQPFYYAALSRSLMDQALAAGKNQGLKGKELVQNAYQMVENPTEEMVRLAVSDAATVVFQNKTKLGEAAGTIQKLPVVGQIILPFARTPSAVAMQIISYSPVGAIKTIFENVGKGKFNQREFAQGMGRSTVGTAFLALGYKLAENGMVSLDYPTGNEREQELQKAEGRKPNSILIGGEWRSPIVLGPVGIIILMGAHFQKAVEESGSPTEAAAMAAAGVWKSFLEQTFLTGVSNFAQVLQDPETYAGTYLPNLVASFVPTLVSDVARATDPLERKAQSGFSVEGFTERIQARIPGARQGLEPDIDIVGRERESVGNPLEILADPTRPSPVTTNLVTSEIRRLVDAGFNVAPTKLGDRNGYDVLTPEQNTELWKRTGETLNEKLTGLFNLPQYQKAADDQKGKMVEKIIEKSQNYSRAATVLELTEGLKGDELKTKLKELKEAGLLTRDVYRAYTEIN